MSGGSRRKPRRYPPFVNEPSPGMPACRKAWKQTAVVLGTSAWNAVVVAGQRRVMQGCRGHDGSGKTITSEEHHHQDLTRRVALPRPAQVRWSSSTEGDLDFFYECATSTGRATRDLRLIIPPTGAFRACTILATRPTRIMAQVKHASRIGSICTMTSSPQHQLIPRGHRPRIFTTRELPSISTTHRYALDEEVLREQMESSQAHPGRP